MSSQHLLSIQGVYSHCWQEGTGRHVLRGWWSSKTSKTPASSLTRPCGGLHLLPPRSRLVSEMWVGKKHSEQKLGPLQRPLYSFLSAQRLVHPRMGLLHQPAPGLARTGAKLKLSWNGQRNILLEASEIWGFVQFSSVAQSCPTLCDPMNCNMPGLPVHYQHLELVQTHIHWVSDAIQPSHPLSSPFPPTSVFPTIRVFSNESVLHIRWPKYCSFSFNINPSNEYSGLISFRIGWLDLLVIF